MGGVSMGIAGSIVNQDFFETYLGMRVEAIDMVEFVRRMDAGIYDPESSRRPAWVRSQLQEGKDYNPPDQAAQPRRERQEEWESRSRWR
jgi:L-fucose isomerase